LGETFRASARDENRVLLMRGECAEPGRARQRRREVDRRREQEHAGGVSRFLIPSTSAARQDRKEDEIERTGRTAARDGTATASASAPSHVRLSATAIRHSMRRRGAQSGIMLQRRRVRLGYLTTRSSCKASLKLTAECSIPLAADCPSPLTV
jgi:hypothetical protein